MGGVVLNIVLITHQFLPHFTGGVEIYTLRLARALQQAGHTVTILTGEPTTRPGLAVEVAQETYADIPVFRLSYDYRQRSAMQRAAYNDPLVTAQIKTILQLLQPDIVHALSLSLLMAGSIETAWNLNIPLIYTATDFVLTCRRGIYLKWDNRICTEKEDTARCTACIGPHTPVETWLNRLWRLLPQQLFQPFLSRLEEHMNKKADFLYAAAGMQHRFSYLPKWRQRIHRVIAPSTHMRHMFILNGFPEDKIIVSPYGVEMPEVGFSKIPSPKLRFGFIGRVNPIKGVHLLVEAFRQLPDPGKAQLTIYGGANVKKAETYGEAVQSQAAGLAHIEFAGAVANRDISQIYRHLDVLVVPSIWPENNPITILEAQAHGVPVIASDVPGIADLIQHGVNGLIFANQNITDLATQLERCLTSPELVQTLADNSHLIKSIQDDVKDLEKLYYTTKSAQGEINLIEE